MPFTYKRLVTHKRLGILAAFTALCVAAPAARGDHLRDAEKRSNKAHDQAVEYVRYLQHHVPPSGASRMLQQDAAAIFRSVCELQHSLLFASGQPGEVTEIRRYATDVYRYVTEARQRLKQLEFELKHGTGSFSQEAPHRYPRIGGRNAPRVEILHPVHDAEEPLRHDRKDRDRLRSRLDVLEDRLEDLERTLKRVNDELWPE